MCVCVCIGVAKAVRSVQANLTKLGPMVAHLEYSNNVSILFCASVRACPNGSGGGGILFLFFGYKSGMTIRFFNFPGRLYILKILMCVLVFSCVGT